MASQSKTKWHKAQKKAKGVDRTMQTYKTHMASFGLLPGVKFRTTQEITDKIEADKQEAIKRQQDRILEAQRAEEEQAAAEREAKEIRQRQAAEAQARVSQAIKETEEADEKSKKTAPPKLQAEQPRPLTAVTTKPPPME